jgi:hypothetical protein
MSAKEEAVVKALVVGTTVVAGLMILASNPNCNRGCKTMLEHLTEHVLQDMLTKFLGV